MMNSCLDFEEEMKEGVENTWVFKRELLLKKIICLHCLFKIYKIL